MDEKMMLPVAIVDKFRSFFNIGIKRFFDLFLSIWLSKPTIDIIKFDEWLKSEYGDYEQYSLSMNEYVERIFGKEALNFLKELT